VFSKKIHLDRKGTTISVATALVLMAIDDLTEDDANDAKVVYGYQIMSHLKEGYSWNVKSGTVYPILKKLNRDLLIRKGFAQDYEQDSKRQMIFYKITPKGRKLAALIKALNDDALEAALSSSEPAKRQKTQHDAKMPPFLKQNFTKTFLTPFLENFTDQVHLLVANHRNEEIELDQLKQDISDSIEKLKTCQNMLKADLEHIEMRKNLKA